MHTTSLTPSTHTQVWRPGAEAIVDLGAIAHNVRVLREHAGTAQVMAVVKADAYGHGAVAAGRAAVDAGAAELGVATIDEALALRQGGITAPVLAWLHPPGTDFAPALTADVGVAVSSVHQVGAVLDAVERTGHTAEVTVKVDTGLNRNGVSAADYPALLAELQRAASADAIRLRGIMSHLANGDVPDDPLNDLQAQRFTAMIAEARSRGIEFDVAHLSNSPSAMTRPDLGFDMVRPGIAVYGLSPIPERGDMGLRPAMTLRCTVAMVKPVKAGDGVSYGHTWIAERDTNLALLPIGYADGLYRTLGGRIDILINGRLRRSVGRVCMDQFVVDLGPGDPGVAAGDEAILFGPGTSGEQTAQDWADLLGTIHYEVVTSPRGRVVRTYRESGADGQ
ncbi:alanine racemase [Mycolicibacterium aichiense]|uniref:alanine racemase n=1 Tax=Mycolicibacterium aichiense TaxID=1799 RepID=UPI003D679F9B